MLPTSTFTIFAAGNEQPLPLIIGNTSDDSSVLKDFGLGPVAFAAAVPPRFKPLTTYYPDLKVTEGAELGRRTGRDSLFTAQTYKIAEGRHARATTWRYYFDYTAEGLRDEVKDGARHGDDIPYVLKTGDLAPPTAGNFTVGDRAVEERVSTYWFEFARTGTPACEGSPAWEPHTAGNDKMLYLGATTELKTDYMKAHMSKLEEIGVHFDGVMADLA